MMRTVDDKVRAVLRMDSGDRVPFFCECDRESCYQPVWLSLEEYDFMARCPQPITAHREVSASGDPDHAGMTELIALPRRGRGTVAAASTWVPGDGASGIRVRSPGARTDLSQAGAP